MVKGYTYKCQHGETERHFVNRGRPKNNMPVHHRQELKNQPPGCPQGIQWRCDGVLQDWRHPKDPT